MSRGTFYKWKERFLDHGYEGLREPKSHAPHHLRKKEVRLLTALSNCGGSIRTEGRHPAPDCQGRP